MASERITLVGGIYMDTGPDYGTGKFKFFNGTNLAPFSTYVPIMPFSFEFELPEGQDRVSLEVDHLKKQKKEAAAAFSAMCMEIDKRISELTAITHDAGGAS